nr:peroxisomal membrane protein per10 [Quercus suber]
MLNAVPVLQDPSVSTAPIEQKTAFLRSKNLTQEEIDISLARVGLSTTTQSAAPANYQAQYRAPPQQYGAYQQQQYWQQPPPELPRRDWRDWFIMATMVGGVGYGLYWTAKRYVVPLIAPPTPPQLEQDKASIDASYDKAFALLDQLATDTQELKESERARTERLDAALSEVESVISKMKEANESREVEGRRIARELADIKDQIPRAIEKEKETTDNKLKDLINEVKSLKTLVGNRMGATGRTTPSFTSSATPPVVNPVANMRSGAVDINGRNGATDDSADDSADPNERPAVAQQSAIVNGRFSGGRAEIPAWQKAAAAKRSEQAQGGQIDINGRNGATDDSADDSADPNERPAVAQQSAIVNGRFSGGRAEIPAWQKAAAAKRSEQAQGGQREKRCGGASGARQIVSTRHGQQGCPTRASKQRGYTIVLYITISRSVQILFYESRGSHGHHHRMSQRSSSAGGQYPPLVAHTERSRMRSLPPSRPTKRLILCEDGTWLNSDNGSIKASIAIESNVTRIARAVKSQSSDGIPQRGLAEIVREGYNFIATNWTAGDEIFIFGFSRGAYTARAIAGLIGEVGILTKEGLPFLAEIFRDVQHQHDNDYRPKHPDLPFPDKPSALNPAYTRELERRKLTMLRVPIKVVGVWDTVGALGFPKIGWLTRLGVQSKTMRELSFYDTALGDAIEYAFQALALDERRFAFQPTLWEKLEGNKTTLRQALALDERRFAFQPTLWEKLEGNKTTLRQVWFPGAHANIGGGYDDQQIATISLAWMMAQCQPFIDFDIDYLLDRWEAAEDFYEKHERKVRPWSFGKIWDGMAGIYAVGGMKIRTPGRYTAVNPFDGKPTDDPLIDTYEYIHPCVRSRYKLGGPGINDHGEYDCRSLRDWKLIIEAGEPGAKRPDIFWKSRARAADGFVKFLPEAPLKPLEIELLQYDRETKDYVLKPVGVRKRDSRRRSRSQRPPDD